MDQQYKRVNSFYNVFVKRIFDIIIAIVGLIIGAIPLLIFVIWVKLESKGSAFFVQDRVGRNFKVFKLYKLRSMDTKVFDDNGVRRKDKDRITKSGRIARALSIDEIPQFINVLKGDMSLIGPRPLILRYLPYYTEEELNRHLVRPGLTGLAQVRGRSNMLWDDRFRLDLEYVREVSLIKDLKIFFETIGKVLKKENTSVADRPKKLVDFDVDRKTPRNDAKLVR